ncbi:MAG TPA: 50S ribosomal protein L9 [Actinomycetota bacterium]|nr:50S ribosomal protein L9 [Actinomycetota bacterium]
MRVILNKPVDSLGEPGEVVQVADGYARNYLIPRGLAAPATKGALRHAERLKTGHEQRLRREREEAEAMAGRLAKTPVRITAQAGEEGRLFGQVTSHQISDAIAEQLEERIDHRRLHMAEPIRSVGVHEVAVHLHPEVDAKVTVDVVAR